MRYFIFIFLFSAFTSRSQTKVKRVLFIGNSYTYVNNLPDLVANIAKSNGDSLYYDSNAPGGYTFQNHWNDNVTRTKIALGNWDFVVLQAQSQEPSFSPQQVNAQTYPYALKLDSLIDFYNPCGNTVFYETWGRKNGDASNCANYPPICSYNGMQSRLRTSYMLFADSCKAIVAPAGEAWRQSIASQPTLELYQADESHPSLEGSYLTACVFYETLFKRSVANATFNPGINANVIGFLKSIAASVVTDSLQTWHQGVYSPYAAFNSTQISSDTYSFSSTSSALFHKWYFGDGAVSQNPSPTHQYTQPGTYTVSHVNSRGCEKDSSVQKLLLLSTVGLTQVTTQPHLFVSPQPANDQIQVNSNEAVAKTVLFNLQGQELISSDNCHLNLSAMAPGIYLLAVYLPQRTEFLRIFRE